MISRRFTYVLVAIFVLGSINPAIAQEKKNRSRGIVTKVVAAYVIYKIVKHHKDKQEEKKAKALKNEYIEPFYDYEECEDEDECEEE